MNDKTQERVADLIAELYKANLEVVQPSAGPPETVKRDPHLRLLRCLGMHSTWTPMYGAPLKRKQSVE